MHLYPESDGRVDYLGGGVSHKYGIQTMAGPSYTHACFRYGNCNMDKSTCLSQERWQIVLSCTICQGGVGREDWPPFSDHGQGH